MAQDTFADFSVKGPALVYVSDDGTFHVLDRLPAPAIPGTVDDRLSARDRNILFALWDTFTGSRMMR